MPFPPIKRRGPFFSWRLLPQQMNFPRNRALIPQTPRRARLSRGEWEPLPAFVEGEGEDRHYYDFEFEALLFSSLPFIFFFRDLTAVSHHNWCLKDIAKMSVSRPQLTYLPSGLIRQDGP